MKIQANPIDVGKYMTVFLKLGDSITILPEKVPQDSDESEVTENLVIVGMNKRGAIVASIIKDGKTVNKIKLQPQEKKGAGHEG